MQTYKHKQNARRAARAAGLDPDASVGVTDVGLYYVIKPGHDDGLDMPEPLMIAESDRKAARDSTPIIRPPATTTPPPRRPSKPAPQADKTSTLIAMLNGANGRGASVEAMTKATGWKPHTLRARISELAKSPHALTIVRERNSGETSYRIVSGGQ